MPAKFSIAIWAGSGIGGTEKAAVLFALHLARRGHRLVYLSPPGPRDASLAQGNIRRLSAPGSATDLAALIQAEQIDAVHQYVPGYPLRTPIYDALRLLGDRRPRVIETNVFGRLEDPQNDSWIDFRCFISSASAVQAFRRSHRRLDPGALAQSTALYFPVSPLEDATRRRDDIRREFNLRPDEIFILRLGRTGHKWNRDEVNVFQRARRRNHSLRLLLMEPSQDIWNEVEAGRWGDGILLHRALSDFDRVAAFYSAGDLMLHMSDWGESFGYTIAEAMQHRLPVITRTTPWCDNAQVELVEHGSTGYVCNSHAGAAEGLLLLAADAAQRRRFGLAAAERIDLLSNADRETDLLEEILGHVIQGQPLSAVARRNEELLQFQSTFAEREHRVIEKERPSLALARWRGEGYGAYRALRVKMGMLKSALRRP